MDTARAMETDSLALSLRWTRFPWTPNKDNLMSREPGPQHFFFYTYTCKQGKESGWARNAAIQATLNSCQGYIYGVGGAELWSRDWDPNNPNYAKIKLTNPRFGDPG